MLQASSHAGLFTCLPVIKQHWTDTHNIDQHGRWRTSLCDVTCKAEPPARACSLILHVGGLLSMPPDAEGVCAASSQPDERLSSTGRPQGCSGECPGGYTAEFPEGCLREYPRGPPGGCSEGSPEGCLAGYPREFPRGSPKRSSEECPGGCDTNSDVSSSASSYARLGHEACSQAVSAVPACLKGSAVLCDAAGEAGTAAGRCSRSRLRWVDLGLTCGSVGYEGGLGWDAGE